MKGTEIIQKASDLKYKIGKKKNKKTKQKNNNNKKQKKNNEIFILNMESFKNINVPLKYEICPKTKKSVKNYQF